MTTSLPRSRGSRRTTPRTARGRRRLTAAVTAGVLACTLAACGDDEPEEPGTDPSASETPTDEPTSEPAEPTEPTSEPTDEPEGAVPAYWVTDSGAGPRLVREFAPVEGDQLTGAANLVTGGGEPQDPDYRTLWPLVEVEQVSATDGVLLVEIPGDGFTTRPDGMTRRQARLAVQQLVYTLQGVQGERVPVVIQREGDLPLFGEPTGTELTAASVLRTLNLVNITTPTEGETVSGDTLTVTGVANSFEASGPCRLLVDDREIALAGYQSAGWIDDKLYAFEVDLPLADAGTGEVLVRCETDDPTGGTEGFGPFVDTKLITVE